MLFEIKDLDKLLEEVMKASRTIDAEDRYLYKFNFSSNIFNYYLEYLNHRYAQTGRTREGELRIWGLKVSEDKSLPDNHYELVKHNEQ